MNRRHRDIENERDFLNRKVGALAMIGEALGFIVGFALISSIAFF